MTASSNIFLVIGLSSLLVASCIFNFFVVGRFFYFVKIFISTLYTCYNFSSVIKIQEKGYP